MRSYSDENHIMRSTLDVSEELIQSVEKMKNIIKMMMSLDARLDDDNVLGQVSKIVLYRWES